MGSNILTVVTKVEFRAPLTTEILVTKQGLTTTVNGKFWIILG